MELKELLLEKKSTFGFTPDKSGKDPDNFPKISKILGSLNLPILKYDPSVAKYVEKWGHFTKNLR